MRVSEVGWAAPFPQHAPVEPRPLADIAKPLPDLRGPVWQSISQQVAEYRSGGGEFDLTATLTATGVDNDGQEVTATDNLPRSEP